MTIVEIKVTLDDVEPWVSRILQVPANIRLDRLRLTLQAAMGWTNSHLYPFEAGQATWGLPDPDFGSEDLPANKHTLWDVIEDTGRKTIHYIHDFGDDWEHKIKIGKFSDPVPGELHPRLIKVTGRCPPEDIGGFPGHQEFLAAMADSEHPDHEHLKDWFGENLDPNQPETHDLKLEVLKLAKRWKPRKPRRWTRSPQSAQITVKSTARRPDTHSLAEERSRPFRGQIEAFDCGDFDLWLGGLRAVVPLHHKCKPNDAKGQSHPTRSPHCFNTICLARVAVAENRLIGVVAPLARCPTSRHATRLAD